MLINLIFNIPWMQAQKGLPIQITEEALKQAEEEIETFRASLSAEDREKFDNDVVELTKALENMSEKELEEFFTQLAQAEQETPAPAEPEPIKPTPITPQEQAQHAEPTPTKKIETKPAEQLIDDIITRIDSFLLKTAIIEDFAYKVSKWQRNEKIIATEQPLRWSSLQYDVQLFKQRLLKLKDKDPKTKEFRYIFDFMDDKEVIEKLHEFSASLATYEPTIIIGTKTGLQSLSKASKGALRKVIDNIITTIYTDKISEKIDKIFEKYEPTAKKIKENEEKKEQRALESSKQTRTPESAKTAGYQPSAPMFQEIPAPSYGPSPSGYVPNPPSTSRSPSEQPSTVPSGDTTPRALTPKTSSGAPTGEGKEPSKAPKTEEKSGKEAEKNETKEEHAAPEKKSPSTPQEPGKETKQPIDMRTLDKMLKDIERLFEKISSNLSGEGAQEKETKEKQQEKPISAKKGDELKSHILTAKEPDFGLVKRFNLVTKDLQSLKEKLEKFKKGIADLSANNKKGYTDDLKDVYEKYKEAITDFLKQLKFMEGDTWYASLKKISNDIRYAYFHDLEASPSKLVKESVKEPANLVGIKQGLNEIGEMVKAITKK
jgi:hypothetical protein